MRFFLVLKKNIKSLLGKTTIATSVYFSRQNSYARNEKLVLSLSFSYKNPDRPNYGIVMGRETSAIISVFAIKEEDFSSEKRNEFITEILPKIKEIYDHKANIKNINTLKQYNTDVKLIDGEFIIN